MIQTGSRLEEFGWHSRGTCLMPRVQKSLPHRTLHWKKKIPHQLFHVVVFFSVQGFLYFLEEEGDFFYESVQLLELILIMHPFTMHIYIWSHTGLHFPVCVYSLAVYVCTLVFHVFLHNNETCIDLMTAVVDFMLWIQSGDYTGISSYNYN